MHLECIAFLSGVSSLVGNGTLYVILNKDLHKPSIESLLWFSLIAILTLLTNLMIWRGCHIIPIVNYSIIRCLDKLWAFFLGNCIFIEQSMLLQTFKLRWKITKKCAKCFCFLDSFIETILPILTGQKE